MTPAAPGLLLGLLLSPVAPLSVPAEPEYGAVFWHQGNGLPHDTVSDVAQTDDGYLWIATKAGLARFDGVRFVPFLDPGARSLGDGEVSVVLPDGPGLWAGTLGGGLIHIGTGAARTYTMDDGLASEFVRTLARGPDGTLWVGTEAGLCARTGERFRCFGASEGISQSVRSLLPRADGSVLVGMMNGLALWRDGRATDLALPSGSSRATIFSLMEDEDGSVWAGTTAGLLRRRDDGWTRYTTADGLPSDQVGSLPSGPGRRDVDRHPGRRGPLDPGSAEERRPAHGDQEPRPPRTGRPAAGPDVARGRGRTGVGGHRHRRPGPPAGEPVARDPHRPRGPCGVVGASRTARALGGNAGRPLPASATTDITVSAGTPSIREYIRIAPSRSWKSPWAVAIHSEPSGPSAAALDTFSSSPAA